MQGGRPIGIDEQCQCLEDPTQKGRRHSHNDPGDHQPPEGCRSHSFYAYSSDSFLFTCRLMNPYFSATHWYHPSPSSPQKSLSQGSKPFLRENPHILGVFFLHCITAEAGRPALRTQYGNFQIFTQRIGGCFVISPSKLRDGGGDIRLREGGLLVLPHPHRADIVGGKLPPTLGTLAVAYSSPSGP